MRKRLFAALAALVLALGGSLAVATPAQAAVFGCPDGGYICFYNYESYNAAGGIYVWYQGTGVGNCHVLPTSGQVGWTNGKVYNATTSILFNWTGDNLIQRQITFYDANTCSNSDYKFAAVVYPGQLTGYPRLADFGWNDRIGSFKVCAAVQCTN